LTYDGRHSQFSDHLFMKSNLNLNRRGALRASHVSTIEQTCSSASTTLLKGDFVNEGSEARFSSFTGSIFLYRLRQRLDEQQR
jgi:hypothetical protein